MIKNILKVIKLLEIMSLNPQNLEDYFGFNKKNGLIGLQLFLHTMDTNKLESRMQMEMYFVDLRFHNLIFISILKKNIIKNILFFKYPGNDIYFLKNQIKITVLFI